MWKPANKDRNSIANLVLGIYKEMWNQNIKEISEDRTHSNDICLLVTAIVSVIVIIIGHKHFQESIKCIGFPAETTKKIKQHARPLELLKDTLRTRDLFQAIQGLFVKFFLY